MYETYVFYSISVLLLHSSLSTSFYHGARKISVGESGNMLDKVSALSLSLSISSFLSLHFFYIDEDQDNGWIKSYEIQNLPIG